MVRWIDRYDHGTSRTGDETIPSIASNGKWRGDIAANYAGLGSVSLLGGSGSNYDVSIALDGLTRWRIDRTDAAKALKKQIKALDYDNKKPLYVVDEAIALTAIQLSIARGADAKVDASVKSGQVFSGGDGSTAVTSANESKIVLDQKFTEPHYIFYKPREVSSTQGLGTNNVLLIEVVSLPSYTSEKK